MTTSKTRILRRMAFLVLALFWFAQSGCASVITGKAAMFVGKKVYEKVSDDKGTNEEATQN